MNTAQVELLSNELDEMSVIEDDPHIKQVMAQVAAMLRVLLHRYDRVVKDQTTFDDRVGRMLL
jgi:hypothetical protein